MKETPALDEIGTGRKGVVTDVQREGGATIRTGRCAKEPAHVVAYKRGQLTPRRYRAACAYVEAYMRMVGSPTSGGYEPRDYDTSGRDDTALPSLVVLASMTGRLTAHQSKVLSELYLSETPVTEMEKRWRSDRRTINRTRDAALDSVAEALEIEDEI